MNPSDQATDGQPQSLPTAVAAGMSATVRTFGSIILSIIIISAFAAVTIMVYLLPPPAGAEGLVTGLLETLKAMAMIVVGYWLGSSSGSAAKDRSQ